MPTFVVQCLYHTKAMVEISANHISQATQLVTGKMIHSQCPSNSEEERKKSEMVGDLVKRGHTCLNSIISDHCQMAPLMMIYSSFSFS